MSTLELGVLCSGGGTNFQSILDAIAAGTLDARVRIMITNRADAGAIERAKLAGIEAKVLSHKDYASREDYDRALVAALRDAGVELVVLAGFMRIITPVMLDAFADRVINIHPAILPSFPGVDGQRQAREYGVTVAGCTVHLVDAGTDTGPILAQAVVPVLDDDDRDTLAKRILRYEHTILPEVLRWFAAGRVHIDRSEGRTRVKIPGVSRAFGLLDS
ncbi:MAG: phosphoribosylglycinamide formyltransferase [Polyangiaceae bacterium]